MFNISVTFKFFGYLLLQTLCFAVFAQNKKIDSLQNQLAAVTNDTSKVDLLNNLAYQYYTTDYLKTHAYCEQAIKLAGDLKYERGKSKAYQIAGLAYLFQDNYAMALRSEQRAIALASKTNDYDLMARGYNTAGMVYNRLNDTLHARQAFYSALEAMAKTTDKKYSAAILHNLASLSVTERKYTQALNDFNKAAALNAKSNNKQWLVQNYFGIGRTYNLLKDYRLALNYLSMARRMAHQMNYYQPEIKSLNLSASIYIELKKYPMALGLLQEAEKIAVSKNISGERLATYNAYADLYERQNNYQLTAKYLRKYQSLYDSTFNSDKSKLVAEYQAQFQNQHNKLENEVLKKQQLINAGRILERNYFLMALSIILLFTIIFAAISYKSYLKIKEKSRITQLQKDEIETQKHELENLNHIKDKLFSVIAHDLRGPLSTLQSVLTLFDEGVVNNEEVEMVMKGLGKQVSSNRSLVDNLLIWAKSQLNGFHVRKEPIDLKALFGETIEAVQNANNKHIIIYNHIESDSFAQADREMLRTVIRNLLGNAVKFTPSGGSINVTAVKEDQVIKLCVADTGSGIPADQVCRLFKGDFYSVRSKDNIDGTGLGLQICKEFVERNGGKIWVKSIPGQGSNFYFTLPIT